jgi:hypothetical protein
MQLGILAIRHMINESFRKLHVVDTTPYDPGDRERMQGSIEKGQTHTEGEVQDEIDDLSSMPEFEDINAFIAYKLDNEEYSYNFIELQTLARNVARKRLGNPKVSIASSQDTARVRQALEKETGFAYVPREPPKNIRGATSNPNGTHPFAGSGGGGSGFGSDADGPSFASFGGGPGAIGGKYKWNSEDSKNLPMGSRRR